MEEKQEAFIHAYMHAPREPNTAKICCEQKTAELAEFTIQSRLSGMKKFPVYALILTK